MSAVDSRCRQLAHVEEQRRKEGEEAHLRFEKMKASYDEQIAVLSESLRQERYVLFPHPLGTRPRIYIFFRAPLQLCFLRYIGISLTSVQGTHGAVAKATD